MLSWFERLVPPFPDNPPEQPPAGFFAFIWSSTQGIRGLILLLAILTALIGAFEALLFAMLGNIVDWLSKVPPHLLWQQEKQNILLLTAVLLASPLLIAAQALVKYQALNGNFAMRLRWNFHRHLLGQSMTFFQDEFSGRVSAKMMQTALAVRDAVMIVTDILVFVVIYFLTMTLVAGSFDRQLLLPFFGWLILYVLTLMYFVPRLGRAASAQADARSLMSGRVTDAYSNIATVKLFSHNQREALYAKQSMQEFLATVYRQMRLVTGFEIVNHILGLFRIFRQGEEFFRATVNLAPLEIHDALAQRFVGGRLLHRRQRRVDIQAAGVGVVPVLAVDQLANSLGHVLCMHPPVVLAFAYFELLFFSRNRLLCGDEPVFLHALNDVELA